MSNSKPGLLSAILLVALVTPVATAAEVPAAPVRLMSVAPVDTATGSALEVRLSGPFSYTSYQPDGRSLIVDLAGVVSDSLEPAGADELAWVDRVRLLPFRNASGNHVLRLDLSLSRDCEVDVSRANRSTLSLACEGSPKIEKSKNPPSEPAPVKSAASVSASRPRPVPVSTGPVAVERISVHKSGSGLVVEIRTAAPVAYETLSLENPARLVVDVPGGILQGRARKIRVDSSWVSTVRVAQFKPNPPITRVVLDLKKIVPHRIESTENGLRVVLYESASVSASKAAGTRRPAEKQAAAARTAPAPVKMERPAPQRTIDPVQVASLAPTLPAGIRLPEKKAIDIPAVPVRVVRKVAAAKAGPVVARTPSAAPDRTRPADPPPVFQEATAAAAPETSEFTGEPISVNLKDVDLKDFFRLIHEISGLNVVLDPTVSGQVTLVLIDVPWDQALDIVLRNNGLDKTMEGNVLRIASRSTLKQESEDKRDLDQARLEAVDPVTVTRTLNYARAEDLEGTLTRFLSSRGQLMRDDRTNTLIIRDIPSVLPALDDLIRQLDRKSQQVEIEARVVSASRNFSRSIGSQLATGAGTRNRRQLWGGGQGGPGIFGNPALPPLGPIFADESNDGVSTDPTLDPLQLPPAVDLGAVGKTSGIFYHHGSPNFAIDVILSAAESKGIAKVLSRPRVITQNNVQAVVRQGFSIPIQTVVNNTVSVQFIDAALTLTVTPQITGDGNIFLNVNIENNRPDFSNTVGGNPSIITQAATTQVMVNDGGTVVIGGVLVTDNSTSIDQVPLLGSIPIIGHLFKRTSVATNTQELLFFITPRILPD